MHSLFPRFHWKENVTNKAVFRDHNENDLQIFRGFKTKVPPASFLLFPLGPSLCSCIHIAAQCSIDSNHPTCSCFCDDHASEASWANLTCMIHKQQEKLFQRKWDPFQHQVSIVEHIWLIAEVHWRNSCIGMRQQMKKMELSATCLNWDQQGSMQSVAWSFISFEHSRCSLQEHCLISTPATVDWRSTVLLSVATCK